MQRFSGFIFLFLFACSINSKEMESLLILNMKNESVLPRNFRTTQSPFKSDFETHPTRKGLDELKLSGTSQFSEKAFESILDQLGHPNCLYVIDLRQESHGFLNGNAVSWYTPKDWGNVGKTLPEIEKIEKQLLQNALQQHQLNLYNIVKKDAEGHKLPETVPMPLVVTKATTEQDLVTRYGAKYLRLPVTDHMRPSDDIVDQFVTFVRDLPNDCWVLIHCAAGMGRSTTFMIMFDMMKNAKQVSFDDILKRQWLIGGLDFKKPAKYAWKMSYALERKDFIKDFYEYAHTNKDQFQQSWSSYIKAKQINNDTNTPVYDRDRLVRQL